jgi:hypothetical protein
MIKKFIYLILPVAAILSVIVYSCSSDVYDEDDIVIVRDTVTIVTDTTIKEQREFEKIKLMLVIQLGAFREKDHADNFASTVREKLNGDVIVRNTGNMYLVTSGNFSDAGRAQDYLYTVKSKGFDKAFVRNIKY